MTDKKGKAKSVLRSGRNWELYNSATCIFGALVLSPEAVLDGWTDGYSSWKCIPQQLFCTLPWQLSFLFHSSNKPALINLYFHSCSIHNYFYHLHGLTWTIMLLLLVRLFWYEIVRSRVPISHLCITYSHFFSTKVFISKTSITLAALLWSLSSLSGSLLKHVAQNWT